MSGHSIFNQITQELIRPPAANNNLRITRAQFESWQQQVSFDLLKGQRYGQSFCNYFGITDNILYYEFSWLNADEYIRRAYIDRP